MEKNLYELMIQQSPVASIVFEIIKSGEAVPSAVAIFDANPAFERLSGVSRDKIVRKLISEIEPEICNRWFDWIVNDIKNTFSIAHSLFSSNKEEEAHNHRVGELCREIARAMDLDQETTNDIATAGFFHDIGKIGVNQKILLKTTPLTDDEWVELKRHPEKGYQILKSSAEFAQAAQYVLCHHERIDGQGYPQGLSGEDIPLPAKILTVADAYDSMTNPRQYHKKLDQKEVIEELKRNAGTQFDVFVTRVFIEKVLHQI